MKHIAKQILVIALFLVSMTANAMIINIKIMPTETTFQLTVEPNETIDNVKQKIYDSQNIPVEYQRLNYVAQYLADGNTLSDYNINDGATIHLIINDPHIPKQLANGSWKFSMPNGNRTLKVEYKAVAGLAWKFGDLDSVRVIEDAVIGYTHFNNIRCPDLFPTLAIPTYLDSSKIRYGSTNESTAKIYEGNHINLVGVGTTVIYAVYNDAEYYDSVYYTLTVENSVMVCLQDSPDDGHRGIAMLLGNYIDDETSYCYFVIPGDVTVQAVPVERYYLQKWVLGEDENTHETYVYGNDTVNTTFHNITKDTTITAYFEPKPTMTLVADGNGTVEIEGATRTSPWTTKIFDYCYGINVNYSFPVAESQNPYSISGFGHPFNQNKSWNGPWKVEYVGEYTTDESSEFGQKGVQIIQQTYGNNIHSFPKFRLYQWKIIYNDYDYNSPIEGTIFAYANEDNPAKHAAFFVTTAEKYPDTVYTFILTDSTLSNTSELQITFDKDLSTGIDTIINATTTNLPAGVMEGKSENEYIVDYDTNVTVTATPAEHHYMQKWNNETALNSNDAVNTPFHITKDTILTAHFVHKPTLTIASNNDEWGSVKLDGVNSSTEPWETKIFEYCYSCNANGTNYPHNNGNPWNPVLFNSSDENPQGPWKVEYAGDYSYPDNTFNVDADGIYALKELVYDLDNDQHIPIFRIYRKNNNDYQHAAYGTVCAYVNNNTSGHAVFFMDGEGRFFFLTDAAVQSGAPSITFTEDLKDGVPTIVGATTTNLPAGVVEGNAANEYIVDYGTEVAVKANPNTGYHLASWTPAHSNNLLDTAHVTVTADTNLTANFAANVYSITLHPNDGTINEGDVSSYTYGEGANLPINVTRTGYTFNGWFDNINLTGDAVTSISTTAIGDTEFWAKWTINSYTITAQEYPANTGSVSGTAGNQSFANGTYDYGTAISLMATPALGYHFVKWTNNEDEVVSTNATYNFTVTDEGHYMAHFAIDTFTLTLATNNSAWGSVALYNNLSDLPAGVFQGTSANTYRVIYGTEVAVKALPNTGYHLDSWTPAHSNNLLDTAHVTVTTDTNLTANFAANVYSITLHPNDGTINEGDVSSYTYGEGANLPINVTRTGYTFNGWFDNINLTGDAVTSISTTAIGDTEFWAKWTINSYTITAQEYPANTGSVSGTADNQSFVSGTSYHHGTAISLTATPALGHHFVKWTNNEDEVVSTVPSFNFTVTDEGKYKAHFAINTYTLTLKSNPAHGNAGHLELDSVNHALPAGVVASTDTIYKYIVNYGTKVKVKAIPAPHYHLASWSNTGGNDLQQEVTITQDMVITGVFAIDTFTLTLQTNDINKGTVEVTNHNEAIVSHDPDANGTRTYKVNYGAEVIIKATANVENHYHLASWSNGATVNTEDTIHVFVTTDSTITANFAINTYAITATANPAAGGTVTGAGSYNHGKTCTLMATANEGYTFTNWMKNGTLVSTNPTYSFTVTEAADYVANFTLNSYTITATANPTTYGSVSGAGTYNYGATCTLTTTSATGYHFVNWTKNNDVVSTNATYSFTVTHDSSFVANFSPNTYTVTLHPNGGTVTGGNVITRTYGENILLPQPGRLGHDFGGWYDDENLNIATVISATTIGDKEAWAKWTATTYNVFLITNGGTINSGNVNSYIYGEGATLPTDVTRFGYTFDGWYSDVNLLNKITSISTTSTGAVTLYAKWIANTYHVTLNTNGGTIISGDVSSYTYGEGANLPTDVTRTGHTFDGWYTNANLTGDAVTSIPATATGDTAFWAKWNINSYTIAASADPTEGGTVTGAGSYEYSANVTLTAAYNPGYHFVKWIEADTVYSTEANITVKATGNRTFTAQFELSSYDVTASVANTADVRGTVQIAYTDVDGQSQITAAGATAQATVQYGSTCTLTATPATGYHFVKWTNANGDSLSNLTTLEVLSAVDTALTAVFAPDTFTITYMDGDVELNVDTFYYQQSITEYTSSKTGWDFIGWSPEVPALMPAENLTVYAQWYRICDSVKDVDNNAYPSVNIGNICWMAANMRATHYANGNEIPGVYEYQSAMYPNVTENVSLGGLLYDWYAAMDVEGPTKSTSIQGICPNGWHIPTAEDAALLNAVPATELRTTTGWVTSDINTNSTGFSAYPAGFYNSTLGRFEGMGSQTDWWTVSGASVYGTTSVGGTTSSIQIQYYCDTYLIMTRDPKDAISVRCVKD